MIGLAGIRSVESPGGPGALRQDFLGHPAASLSPGWLAWGPMAHGVLWGGLRLLETLGPWARQRNHGRGGDLGPTGANRGPINIHKCAKHPVTLK